MDPLTLRDGLDLTADLLDRMRQDRQVHVVPNLVVEGDSDRHLLIHCASQKIRAFVAGSRSRVVETARRADAAELRHVTCLVDRDFDDLGIDPSVPNCLVFTDNADIEAMLYHSGAFDRLLDAFADDERLQRFGGSARVRRVVEDLLAPLSVLRRENALRGWDLSFRKVGIAGLVVGDEPRLEVATLLTALSSRCEQVSSEELRSCLSSESPRCPVSGRILLRGHDILQAVTALLRIRLASSPARVPKWEHLEKSLRLTASRTDIESTTCWRTLEARWSAS